MVADHRATWDRLTAALNALSPLDVLKKGYTLVWTEGGLRLARRIEDIAAGESVQVSFFKGEFSARVESVDRKKIAGIPVPEGGIMTNLTFEKALAELEQIVAKLEKGALSLNESLALFEKGVKLSRFLRAELDKAERKVEILLKDEKGNLKAEDFEAEEARAKGRGRTAGRPEPGR